MKKQISTIGELRELLKDRENEEPFSCIIDSDAIHKEYIVMDGIGSTAGGRATNLFFSRKSTLTPINFNQNKDEWQLVDKENWIYGEKIRGIIRSQKAEIYYDLDWKDEWGGGWRWMVFDGKLTGGYAPSRPVAIDLCELALGVVTDENPNKI